MTEETLLDLSKTWVDNNNRFSTPPFVPKDNNNYCTADWHIKPQPDNEQGINKLQSKKLTNICYAIGPELCLVLQCFRDF